jgi:hypothetical protein
MQAFLKKYARSLVAVGAALASTLAAAWTGDQHIDVSEWSNVILAGTAAAAVFTAADVPGAKYTKAVLAVIIALAAPATLSLVTDGISWTDAWQLAAGAAAALGIRLAPYTPGSRVGVAG